MTKKKKIRFILVSLRDTVCMAKEDMVVGDIKEFEVAGQIVSTIGQPRDECWC